MDGRRYDYAFNDYFHAEQRYRKSGSKIVSKSISAFEAAPEKMDAAYARVKDERNAFFQHFHVQMLIVTLFLAAVEFLLYSGWREKLALAPILSGKQSGCAPELQELSFDGRLAAVEFLLYFVFEAVDTAMFAFLASVFLAAALYYLVSVLMLRNARKAYVRRRT